MTTKTTTGEIITFKAKGDYSDGKDAIMELLTEQLRQHDEETIRDYKATLLRKCTDDKAFRALGIVLEAASKA